jgi:alpha-L-rhamnosidase
MLTLSNLKTEYAENPLGLDTPAPRFSWQLEHPSRGQVQTAYQVQAASSPELLAFGAPDLWDSGKILSCEQLGVTYAGISLTSRQRVYWRARAWDRTDFPGPFSEPAWFELGLLHPEDWQAEWMGLPALWNGKALYLHCEFKVEKPIKRARIYIAGLGCYELHLNGARIGDHVLDPGFTDTGKRILYVTDDVADILRVGLNRLGVILGNGWYGTPKVLLQAEVTHEDGAQTKVCSSHGVGAANWQATTGPLLENSIFGGETYNAKLERPGWDLPSDLQLADSPEPLLGWGLPVVADTPGGRLVAQTLDPMRITRLVEPVEISQPKPGVYVFDLGQNIAGWARLYLHDADGCTVTMRYAESLFPDGTINQENLRMARATDTYTCCGKGIETWEPRFTYHGFRYVQVEGLPRLPDLQTLTGCVVRSDLQPAGEFECGSELLNRIHRLVRNTEASNQHSIPTDCPQRDERMGWLNDMGARLDELLFNYNASRFLPKWLDDIQDAQHPLSGAITDTAPYRFGSRPADPVSVCYLLIPWQLYRHYGDRRILSEHYIGLKAWVDYLVSRSTDGILAYCYYGDWAPPISEGVDGSSPVSAHTPGALVSTAFLFYHASLLVRIAQVLGNALDATLYTGLAEHIRVAFNREFWNEALGGYGSNNQACNVLALYVGLAPEERKPRIFANLVHDVETLHHCHLTTGNLCTRYLLEVLSAFSRSDLALKVALQTTYPSWGFMLENGATSLWERWELATGSGMNSHNHPMLGSVGSWLYKVLGGIDVQEDAVGFDCIFIHPYITPEVGFCRAAVNTMRGRVESAWQTGKNPGSYSLQVRVPVNSRADVVIPALGGEFTLCEGNQEILLVKDGQAQAVATLPVGIDSLSWDGGMVRMTIGSGHYRFDCS